MPQLFQTDRLFKSLVKEINQLIDEDVIVTNEAGIVVASTDLKRINQFHEGAALAMKQGKKMIITAELTKELKGVRKGIVLPIVIEETPIGVLGITGNPLKVEPHARIVQKMAELFIQGTVDQMTQEKMTRNIELFVFDWINENIPEDLLLSRSDFFNLDIKKYSQIISIQFPFTGDDLSYKDINFFRTQWDQKGIALFIRWGQGKLLIIDQAHDKKTLHSKINTFLKNTLGRLDENACFGVGQALGYKNITLSYDQAERACLIASKTKQITFEEELQFEMLQYALDKTTKKIFIERTISLLREDRTMLVTLRSWLENDMSIQKTAAELYIHKNTLYYRLKKIESLTKLKVNSLDDVILLYIGNRFLEEKT